MASGIISSIIFKFKRSFDESFIASAASNVFFGSLQSIVHIPLEKLQNKLHFLTLKLYLKKLSAIAPPEPPSPIIIDIVGTFNSIQHSIDLAIASACPLSSAPTPG